MKNSSLPKLGALPFLLLSLVVPSIATASHEIGKVIEVKGKAFISGSPDSSSKLVELHAGSTLQNGVFLSTDPNSELTLVLDNKDAALRIKGGSRMKVNLDSKKDWLVDLQKGMLVSQVKPTPNNPKHYQVKTRTAVMGVRGTTFFVKVEPGKDLFLCTCIGSVSINDQLTITSKHHDAPKLIREGKEALSSRLTAMDMGHDHSDDDAMALMALIK